MVCKQCGHEIAPDEKFCGICGAVNEDAVSEKISEEYSEPAGRPIGTPDQGPYAQPYVPPVPQSEQSQYAQPQTGQYTQEELSSSILKFGIWSLVLSCLVPLLGIIFGAVTMSKAKNYALIYPLEGRAKTGKILGLVGFILAIVVMVIAIIVAI